MKLSLLLSAAFLACVSADDPNVTQDARHFAGFPGCMIPPGFPYHEVYDPWTNPNSTLTIADVVDKYYKRSNTNNGDQAGVDPFLEPYGPDGKPQPWRRDPKTNIVVIPYCFRNQGVSDKLRQAWYNVLSKFYSDMGGPASAQSGHAVLFKEVTKDGNAVFCYNAGHDTKYGSGWNDDISEGVDVLSVESNLADPNPDPQMYATVGLDQQTPPAPWRNFACFTNISALTVTSISMSKWQTFKAWKKHLTVPITTTFMSDYNLMVKYNCLGYAFMKQSANPAPGGAQPYYARGPYDVSSIMHYNSAVAAPYCGTNWQLCTIGMWQNTAGQDG
ncbi:hypothetical protein K491DRAFT_683064 [Lophiostoma macrostomum CBS 122681]|uniref:Peptidase M12A domain-containing protein n=1 Tax=Lophiostoma macrostomum CBS 122681 TaxID=1314788 RepID=A0A6A6SRJ8_9PLEO|nr:hypothetical protein K491DRAFT_683064 [Lophiostoma macrostomum CBS 122681]